MQTYSRVRDGTSAPANEALDERGCLRDGYRLNFSALFMDSHAQPQAVLRDAAGQPVRLIDRDTHRPFQLTDALIAAITAEAGKTGMPVDKYTREVLRLAPQA